MCSVNLNAERFGTFSAAAVAANLIAPADVQVDVYVNHQLAPTSDMSTQARASVRGVAVGQGVYVYRASSAGLKPGDVVREVITSLSNAFPPQQNIYTVGPDLSLVAASNQVSTCSCGGIRVGCH